MRSRGLAFKLLAIAKREPFRIVGLDGALYLNYTPSGEEMYDNASLNEELWHLVNLMTLKAEWEEQGRPGDFKQFQDARTAGMAFDFRR